MKSAIQKQIVEFAHRQSSVQLSLQDVYEKRQLKGVSKSKQAKNNIMSVQQIDPSTIPPGLDLSKDEITSLNKQIQQKKIDYLEQNSKFTSFRHLEAPNEQKSKN